MSTITLEVTDLQSIIAAAVEAAMQRGTVVPTPVEFAPSEPFRFEFGEPVQQPEAAKSARRPAKPVSKAQHSAGSVWEVAFGVTATGSLTAAQQRRAIQFFADQDYVLSGKVTMRSIVKAVQDVNASLRGENSSTVRYWAVFNGPSGRLSDYTVRSMLRSSK